MHVHAPPVTDSHTSRGADWRGARAPGVQEGRGVRVDDGGCERARLQPRLRRRGRLDWPRLEATPAPRWLANGQLPRARRLCFPRLRGRWMGVHRLRGRRARRAAPRPPSSTTSSSAASPRSSSTAASRGAPHPMGPLQTPPVGCSSTPERAPARAERPQVAPHAARTPPPLPALACSRAARSRSSAVGPTPRACASGS